MITSFKLMPMETLELNGRENDKTWTVLNRSKSFSKKYGKAAVRESFFMCTVGEFR